jgi:two-component system phosphate regulon sensor histidine kinase PhoR
LKNGVRARLWFLSVGLLLASAVLFTAFVDLRLEPELARGAQGDLAARTALVATRVAVEADLEVRAPALAIELARAAGARVTLVAPGGAVRGDSEVPPERLGELENHRDRPEIRLALESGEGASERDGSTVHEPLLYAARRVDRDGGPWVVRLASFPNATAGIVAEARSALASGALFALLAATGVSYALSSLFARRLRLLTEAARAMRGDLSKRARVQGADEVAELGAALDALTTDLEHTVTELRYRRDELEAILESMQEGVMVTAADGTVQLANGALREMLGVGEDAVGRPPLQVVRNAALFELVEEARAAGRAASREIELFADARRQIMGRASPLAPGGGVVAVLFDVTELRRLETVRRDFVANASHELRTPVASIRAASETLAGGAMDDPEAAPEFVAIIGRNAERLDQLLADLLELSRADAGRLDLRVTAVLARDVCREVIASVERAAAARGTDLALEAPDALPVLAAERQLQQVLFNLLDNAIKYSPPGAHVGLRARGDGARVIFEVSDDGPGIEERHLPRLFERFYRVDAGRSRELGGTGLGLAIVKHMVEAMGGEVSVTSAVGRGTTFRVTLRAAPTAG